MVCVKNQNIFFSEPSKNTLFNKLMSDSFNSFDEDFSDFEDEKIGN